MRVCSSKKKTVFIEEAIESGDLHPNQPYPVIRISFSEAGKGYSLAVKDLDTGTEALVFVWRSSDQGRFLRGYLEESQAIIPSSKVYPTLFVSYRSRKDFDLLIEDTPVGAKEAPLAFRHEAFNPGDTLSLDRVSK